MMLQITSIFSFFSTFLCPFQGASWISKSWPSWVMLLSQNADVCSSAPLWGEELEVRKTTDVTSALPPQSRQFFPRLVRQKHRGGFGGLRAPHPKSCPGVCSCFGTHWQSGRLKFLPRVNFLIGKSCTFHLSLPGLFTPWIKHGINDELVLQSNLKPTEHKALCSC